MSRQISPAASLRSRSSVPASRISGVKSPAASSRIGVRRTPMRESNSAPSLRGQLDNMGASGTMMKSMMLGGMAQTMGAKVASTLHHRGENECGAIIDPNEQHVYVPRAQWTQSNDHPLRPNNAQWNQQHFMASELKRLHGEEKYKEFLTNEIDRQLRERTDNRNKMLNEKKEFAQLVNDDVTRHNQEQTRIAANASDGTKLMLTGLQDQKNHLSRRAQEAQLREAQEHAEMKMRTVQQMCEELAEQNRRKKQLHTDMQKGMQDNHNRRIQGRNDKKTLEAQERQEMREALMQDEYKNQAKDTRVKDAQEQQEKRVQLYERTAGKALREANQALENKIDDDEKKHLMRTDTFFAQRERAREKQRQNMVNELDRQSAAADQKRRTERLAKEADREAIKVSSKRSLDAEMAKVAAKRGEEQQLQQDLRAMMIDKEEREAKEGYCKPTQMATMSLVMRKNGNVTNKMSDLQNSMEASRYIGKPLGREDQGSQSRGVAPLDASSKQIRTLVKNRSFADQEIPAGGSMLGGLMGTLGGGGGMIHCGLMATGGPYLPKAIGLAVQDRKLASHWHEGLTPDRIDAGRKAARRREADKAEVNHD